MKIKYIQPAIFTNNKVVLETMINQSPVPVDLGDNVDAEGIGTKERDTYNYNYEEEAWGTISHSIW